MLSVCRLIRDFPPLKNMEYGIAPGVYSLSREQTKLGSQIHIVTTKRQNLPNHEVASGIQVHRVRTPYNVTSLREISRLEESVGIDIIHAHATSAISYALLRRFLKRRPYVIHCHDTTAGAVKACEPTYLTEAPISSLKERFWTWATLKRQKSMWKRADILIAVCNSVADELQKLYFIPSRKIRVVYNGVDVETFRPVDRETKREVREKLGLRGDPIILYVGHLGPRKAPHHLLKAAPKIIQEFPNAIFVFVGGTPKFAGWRPYLQMLKAIVSKLEIQHNVLFTGEVKHMATLDYYAAADVFVLPTLYEGLPKAVLEAMACGLPIVTTNVSGNSDVMVHEETGLLVEAKNTDQLAKALIQTLSDSSSATLMGLRGRKRAEKYFTWRRAAEKIKAIYEELLPK